MKKSSAILLVISLVVSNIATANPSCKLVFIEAFNGHEVVIKAVIESKSQKLEDIKGSGKFSQLSSELDSIHSTNKEELKTTFRKIHFVTPETKQNLSFQRVDLQMGDKDFQLVVNRTKKVLNRVGKIVRPEWTPKKLHIDAVSNFDNAFHIADSIYIPNQLKFDGFAKHPTKSRAVIAHEYGHDVFSEILTLKSPAYRALNDFKRLSERMRFITNRLTRMDNYYGQKIKSLEESDIKLETRELKKAYYEHMLLASKETAREDEKKLEAEWGVLKAEIDKEFPDVDIDAKVLRALAGHSHEFLADVLAVLTIREKNGDYKADAIHRSLFHTGAADAQVLKDVKNFNRYRDFARKIQVEGWSRSDVHTGLNPVRYHVWKNYISRSLYRQHPRYLFDRIAEATSKEVIDRLNMFLSKDFDEDFNMEKINRRVIRYIDKEFEENPL